VATGLPATMKGGRVRARHADRAPAGSPAPHASASSCADTAVVRAAAYVPRALLESLARNPDRASPWGERIEGTLLMGDVSGFTALSELLAKAGKEGAEWLTDIINSFFGSMIGIAREYGGDTITFGGDAVLLLYHGEGHARRACASALAMLSATARLSAYKVGAQRVRLGMSMGAHTGEFFLGSAGLADSRLQCLLFGPGAARTCQAEAAASSGELLVTMETVEELGRQIECEYRDGFCRVLEVSAADDAAASRDLDPTGLTALLAPYVPPAIAAMLAPGAPEHEPESDHRKVCVVFINIMGVDELLAADGPAAVLRDLQGYVSSVVRLANRHGGYLVSNDVYTLGLKLIVAFGAPAAHEQDTASALRMVCDLRDQIDGMGLRLAHRTGVNAGFVFAGDVGPVYRRQYTVMGDAVNLAARLMSAAEAGETLVSAATLTEAGAGFANTDLAPITVKGKEAPVAVCALTGQCDEVEAADGRSDLVGRDEELRALEAAAAEARDGRGKVAIVRGEPGIGKSRLTQALVAGLAEDSWNVLAGGGQAHTSEQPFAVWATPLRKLLDVSVGDDAAVRARRIARSVHDLRPEAAPWVPLLGPLLGADLPDTEAVHALRDSDRRDRLFALVADLLRARAARAPVALIMEDVHWSDASSLALLEHVAAEMRNDRVLILATSRREPELPKGLTSGAVLVDLEELPAAAAVRIVADALGRRDLPEELARLLFQKARGNPLFIQEVARSLSRSGALDRLLSASGSVLAEQMAVLEIPDRVQGLVMARIDALPERTRDVLRTASVIGASFERSTLCGVLGERLGGSDLDAEMAALTRASLADPQPGAAEPAFRFRHALIQEVAYDSLKFSKRRELHRRIGEHLERTRSADLEPFLEILAHHYSAGRDDAKTRVYSVRAAGKARRLFAHDEAVTYYRRALETVRARTAEATVLRSLIEEKVGDTYEMAGRSGEAAQAFRHALARWRRAQHSIGRARLAVPAIAELTEGFMQDAREAALCHKIGFSYGRTYSDYALTLRWLDKALESLPRGNPALKARISVAESNAWFRKGDYPRAIEWGRLGLRLAGRAGCGDVRAYALTILANSYYDLGQPKTSAQRDASALRLYEELGDLSGQALAHMNLGTGLADLGRTDEALGHYRVALELYSRVGNAREAAMVNMNIGELYVIKGDFEAAAKHLSAVLEDCGRMTSIPFLEGGVCLSLARAYRGLRRFDEAEEYLRRAIDLLEKAGTPEKLASALLVRADVECEIGRPVEAQCTCEHALETARALGHEELQAIGNRTLARIAAAGGDDSRAENLLRESLRHAEHLDAPRERGLALLALADLYATSFDPTVGRRPFRRTLHHAMRILRDVGDGAAVARARELEGSVSTAPSSSRGSA
jgi:class 3 adenylate cyclase/tetratricopeptide (TPR) repeat protein